MNDTFFLLFGKICFAIVCVIAFVAIIMGVLFAIWLSKTKRN